MDKEEVRHLKLFLNRTNSHKQRKDIALFDYIRKNFPDHDENKLVLKLYNSTEKNALYRLKNRLFEDISKSITLQYYTSADANLILYNVGLSRHFQERGYFKISHNYLSKAEKKAKEIQSFELLDIIYSDFIRISQQTLSIDPELYIQKRQEVREELYKLREIDDVLAVLVYRIKLSQNYSAQNTQIIDLLQKTIEDFTTNSEVKNSAKLRFRIYHAVSRILLQQHDFESLEEYLIMTLNEFNQEELFNKNNHDTKLQMLTYLTNALFKNRKYEKSLEYAEMLRKAMEDFGGVLKDRYLFYYVNAQVNNYTILDREKAIEILLGVYKDQRMSKVIPHARVIFNLNLALLYFGGGSFKQANKRLVQLKIDDLFPSLDIGFRLKISVVELIIRYQLDDHDFIDYQLGIIKKEFAKLLKQDSFSRQKTIMKILSKLIFVNNDKHAAEIKKLANEIYSMPVEEATDNDILNYNDWLDNVFA